MRVAALQLDVRRGEVDANVAAVESGVREAVREGVDLVVLPEMWPTSFVDRAATWLAASDAAVERVRALSGELGIAVCGSAFGGAPGEARPRNRLHLFVGGRPVLAYDKVHLFSPTAEPESFSAGDAPSATVATPCGRVAGVVCYDLRFGPLLDAVAEGGPELLMVPAQWPATRATHWRALVLGRAVELQCFVVAANRTGVERVGRRSLALAFPGNSLVVDPHGNVLAEGRGAPGLVTADLDLAEARAARVRVPVRKDRRPEDYRAWTLGHGTGH
jgi:predicted amidohydrolase